MAKTTSQVAVTQGSGVNLSTFDLTSGRRRQTVVLGDADVNGEELLMELPADGSADRGSALKIGGLGTAEPNGPWDELDRVPAWFTLDGQLGVISTTDVTAVYDAGRRTIVNLAFLTNSLNNAAATIISAAVGLSTKILHISVFAVAHTGAGNVILRNGAGGATILHIDYLSAIGERAIAESAGRVICQSSSNTLVELHYSGNAATIAGQVVYYQAPA